MQDDKQPGLSWSAPVAKNKELPAPEPAAPQAATNGASAPDLGFPSSKKTFRPQAPAYAAVLVVGVIAGVLIANALPPSGQGRAEDAAAAAASPTSSTPAPGVHKATPTQAPLVVTDQKAGPSVAVRELSIARPTWVVVYVSREGKPGNALGARLFFASDRQGAVGLLRNTQPGQTYFVGLSVDDGDRTFDLAKDKPLADADGGALWATFRAL